jgi:hypothetical protein
MGRQEIYIYNAHICNYYSYIISSQDSISIIKDFPWNDFPWKKILGVLYHLQNNQNLVLIDRKL